jgi:hypothetical protein
MSTDKVKSLPSQKALNVVKTTDLYYTEFFGNTADPTFAKGLLKSSPNVYKEGSTFFLDYSNSSNSSDLKFLKRFFNKLIFGNTFSISGGNYYDETTQTKYSFDGVYQLSGVTGLYNNFINLIGISYSASLVDGSYYNYNFKTPINFTYAKGVTANYFASKINTSSPFNLEFLGIYGGDLNSEEYLEVGGSTLNTDRYLIDNCIKLNNGQEIVIINSTTPTTNEKLYFKQCNVNLLMRGVPDSNTLSQSKYQNGIIKKINTEQKILDILTNQNLHQRFSRAQADPDNYYDWYAVSETDNFKNVLNPYLYDKLSMSVDYYSYVRIGVITQTTFTNISTSAIPVTTTSTVLNVDNITATSKVYKAISTATIPNIKIDLSDSSLVGWKILPFYDEACSILLNNYYYLNGVPGFDGASFIFVSNTQAPSSFYLKFEKDTVLKLFITV